MAEAQFDFRVDTGRADAHRPLAPDSAAHAVGAGYAAFGQSIRRAAHTLNAVVDAHFEKNKRIEIQADDAAFKAFDQKVLTELNGRALQTGSPEEVEKIYAEYQPRLQKYISGKGEGGAPNIRWKDHYRLLEQSMPAFSMQAKNNVIRRTLEISTQETVAKEQNAITTAMAAGDYSGVELSTRNIAQARGKGPEETKAMVAANLKATDKTQANNLIGAMKQMQPEEADAAYEQFKKDLAGFEHLDEKERGDFLEAAGRERAFAHHRHKAEEDTRQRQGVQAVRSFVVEHQRLPTPAEILTMEGVTDEIRGKLAARRYELIAPEFEMQAAQEFSAALAAYDPDNDPDGFQMLEHLQRLDGFSAPAKKWLNKWIEPRAGLDEKYKRMQDAASAQLTKMMVDANQRGFWKPKVLSYGDGHSKNPLKDPASEFYNTLATALDDLDTFVVNRMKKGSTHAQAVEDFFKQDYIKDIQEKNGVKNFIANMRQAHSPAGSKTLQDTINKSQAEYLKTNAPIPLGQRMNSKTGRMEYYFSDGTIREAR
ncbi:MAG: hypothetical protein WC959_10785 [Kiritimatiellales bacterium]